MSIVKLNKTFTKIKAGVGYFAQISARAHVEGRPAKPRKPHQLVRFPRIKREVGEERSELPLFLRWHSTPFIGGGQIPSRLQLRERSGRREKTKNPPPFVALETVILHTFLQAGGSGSHLYSAQRFPVRSRTLSARTYSLSWAPTFRGRLASLICVLIISQTFQFVKTFF